MAKIDSGFYWVESPLSGTPIIMHYNADGDYWTAPGIEARHVSGIVVLSERLTFKHPKVGVPSNTPKVYGVCKMRWCRNSSIKGEDYCERCKELHKP